MFVRLCFIVELTSNGTPHLRRCQPTTWKVKHTAQDVRFRLQGDEDVTPPLPLSLMEKFDYTSGSSVDCVI